MFAKAIETNAAYTRPLHSIMRSYGSTEIIPGAATLFFVNEQGYAVTCKHVIDLLAQADQINKKYQQFKADCQANPGDMAALEQRYQFRPETIIQVKNTFVDCVDFMSGFTWHTHPRFDLAIIRFNDFKKAIYQGHAVFRKDHRFIKPGNMMCRLGFPFPEFSNYRYNAAADDIEWTRDGNTQSPRFPIDGMMTRFLADKGTLYGIEMSTPGLKGQSGGPLFDQEGLVCGMQFSTKHLHLGFDMEDKSIRVNNTAKTISDYPFIHLGQCIHAEIIKSFLKEKGVKYYEA